MVHTLATNAHKQKLLVSLYKDTFLKGISIQFVDVDMDKLAILRQPW